MASMASLVYGSNMTQTQARREIGGVIRSRVSAPRASQRSSALHVARAIVCDGCGTPTKTGVVRPGATAEHESLWLCPDCDPKR